MVEYGSEPELPDVSAAVRAEWRTDEEEWTRVALEAWEHDRTLIDVVRDHMHRGDTIAVVLPRCTVSGAVLAVGRDVMRVGSDSIATDLQLAPDSRLALRIVRQARAGGSRGESGLTTFRARLLELESAQVRVEVGAFGGDEVSAGWLRVGRDHIAVDHPRQGRVYLPIGSLTWVRAVEED